MLSILVFLGGCLIPRVPGNNCIYVFCVSEGPRFAHLHQCLEQLVSCRTKSGTVKKPVRRILIGTA
jgi:hypothetical protein